MECDSTEVSIDGNLLAMFRRLSENRLTKKYNSISLALATVAVLGQPPGLLCICIKSRLVGDVVLPCDNRTVGQHATGFGDKSSDLAENIVEQRRNQLRNVFRKIALPTSLIICASVSEDLSRSDSGISRVSMPWLPPTIICSLTLIMTKTWFQLLLSGLLSGQGKG